MPIIGRENIEFDQFYTGDNAVVRCMKDVKTLDYDCVLEPSAGDGAFLKHIDNPTVIALDVNPANVFVKKQDFFKFDLIGGYKKVLVIGNPPFGVRHDLSDAFLKKSFQLPGAQTVAFVLPNTYNKATRQKIIPPNWRIKSITPLDRDSFIYEGVTRHVPCSFFVFDKSTGKDLRFDEAKYQEAVDFVFAKKEDFELFIFGANPGKAIMNPLPNNRGYFIKSKIKVSKLIEKLSSIKWVGNSCANGGVAWFTKPEVVKVYNDKFA